MNNMTVRTAELVHPLASSLFLRTAVLCNDAVLSKDEGIGDPMEVALLLCERTSCLYEKAFLG